MDELPKRLILKRKVFQQETEIVCQTIDILCLVYDVIFEIFEGLSYSGLKNTALTCKTMYKNYKRYIAGTRNEKAGVTRLYPHQKEIIRWATKNMKQNERLLCSAYMSAGKTLIGYETCFRLMKNKAKEGLDNVFSLVLVSPNVLRVWMAEAEKHYPDLVKRKNKKIYFYSSMRKNDQQYVEDEIMSLNGVVVVSSLQNRKQSFDNLVKSASFLVFDESHKLEGKTSYYSDITTSPCLYLTASCPPKIDITNKFILNGGARFPELTYEFHYINPLTQEITMSLVDDIINREDRNIFVLVPHRDRRNRHMKDYLTDDQCGQISRHKPVYNYYGRQVTSLKKVAKTGGVLLSSIKVVSEGSNFNDFSCAYFVDPKFCTLQTLQQAVGRFYRRSNIHPAIKMVMITEENTQNWARCRLALIVTRDLKGLDAKSDGSILSINTFLITRGYNINELSDDDLICLYATQAQNVEDNKDLENLEPTLDAKILRRCMLF